MSSQIGSDVAVGDVLVTDNDYYETVTLLLPEQDIAAAQSCDFCAICGTVSGVGGDKDAHGDTSVTCWVGKNRTLTL